MLCGKLAPASPQCELAALPVPLGNAVGVEVICQIPSVQVALRGGLGSHPLLQKLTEAGIIDRILGQCQVRGVQMLQLSFLGKQNSVLP